MASYEIPFAPEPQRFTIALAGVQYSLSTAWCAAHGAWMLDVEDGDGKVVLAGVPLQPGCDVLAPYKHLNLGGSIFVQYSGDPTRVPGFKELGVNGKVFFIVSDA